MLERQARQSLYELPFSGYLKAADASHPKEWIHFFLLGHPVHPLSQQIVCHLNPSLLWTSFFGQNQTEILEQFQIVLLRKLDCIQLSWLQRAMLLLLGPHPPQIHFLRFP